LLLKEPGVIEDRVAEWSHQSGGVVKHLPQDPCLLDLGSGMRLAGGLEGIESYPHRLIVDEVNAAQATAEEVAVLDRHAGTVCGVGGRRVHSVAH
jgi:hypothetical protein